MKEGYIKYMRTKLAKQLQKNKNANHLLNVIAFRASRCGCPIEGLEPGEAKIGDYKEIDLTRQEYRTALKKLVKWEFVTIKTTTKGTIAKLSNSSVYDINEEGANQQANQQATNKQPTSNQQATTNKNERIKEEEEVNKLNIDKAAKIVKEENENKDPRDKRINVNLPFHNDLSAARATIDGIFGQGCEELQDFCKKSHGINATLEQLKDARASFIEVALGFFATNGKKKNSFSRIYTVDKLITCLVKWIPSRIQYQKGQKKSATPELAGFSQEKELNNKMRDLYG